jgi:hypothetical protein
MIARSLLLVSLLSFLTACDQLGIETPAQINQRAEEEGKAIGGSCRHAGRALEDCYQVNPKAPKAAIFAGWRDMDAYMRENKIVEIAPQFPLKPPVAKGKRPLATEETPPAATPAAPAAAETKPAEKHTDATGAVSGRRTI